ncbi:MAG: hypothetical protein ABL930_03285 [Pseudobdellovibrio sp.]
MNKLITGILVLLTSTQVLAGGSTQMPPQFDAIVSCRGPQGEILFNVFKNQYKGQLLNLKNTNAAIIKLTDVAVVRAAKQSGILHERAWDQTAFLKSLGVDPSTVRDHLALFVNNNSKSGLMPVTNLQGGTLKTTYTSNHQVITSALAPYKETAPRIAHFLNITVEQVSERAYIVNFNKIQSGQRQCVRTAELPNPYFLPGSGGIKTFIGCVEFVDISDQQTVSSFSALLEIESCQLK